MYDFNQQGRRMRELWTVAQEAGMAAFFGVRCWDICCPDAQAETIALVRRACRAGNAYLDIRAAYFEAEQEQHEDARDAERVARAEHTLHVAGVPSCE